MVIDIFHPAYLSYDFGPNHPFSPVRLEMTLDLLDSLGHPVQAMMPDPASRGDVLTVHSEELIRCVEAASRGEGVASPENVGLGTPDNPVFPGMDLAARHLVGGTLLGARLLLEGKAATVLQLGGGLHHAQRDRRPQPARHPEAARLAPAVLVPVGVRQERGAAVRSS